MKYNLLIFIIIVFNFSTILSAQNSEDCFRSKAENIIDKEIYPNSVFSLNPDNLTAIEFVELKNGDILTIENTGCEYFILNFIFESDIYNEDIDDLKYWYNAVTLLMNEVKSAIINSPLDIENGIKALENYASKSEKHLILNEEIFYGETEIQSFVYLENISKITDSRYKISIVFGYGPL